MCRPVLALVFLAILAAPVAAKPVHDLFGIDNPEEPVAPDQIPFFASADGSLYAVATKHKTLGCDPEDTTAAGYCDYAVTIEIRGADGKAVETVKVVLGNWKKESDVAALAARLTAHKLARGQAVEMGDRSYTFASGHKLVIEAAGKKLRMKITTADGKVADERVLPTQCRGKGTKTIWGADAFWFADARRLIVRPRGCSQPIKALQVVSIP